MSTKSCIALLSAALIPSLSGCFSSTNEIDVKPVEVKPIKITLDVNIRVQKELDTYFSDLDKKAGDMKDQKAVAPAQTTAEKAPEPAQKTPQQAASDDDKAREEIKARMQERLPVLVDLKSRGIIGETNNGFLAFVSDIKDSEDVVQAANADRKLIYAIVSKREKTTAESVAKARAQKNAERARPGEYVQDASGKWLKKQ